MKSIEIKLIESVLERRNAILDRAKEEAKHILQTATQEAIRIRTQGHEHVSNNQDTQTQILRDQIIGAAELEGRNIVMRKRDEAISQVFQKIEDKLHEIADQRVTSINFNEVLSKLVVEAIFAIGGSTFNIFANPRDSKYLTRIRQKIVKQIEPTLGSVQLQVQNTPLDTMGGVIVQNAEGTKIFYNTLESRLKTTRKRSEAVIAKVLGVL